MERNDNPFNSYAYLDSQRLKDTFFSPPKKRKKKKTHHKKIFLIPTFIFTVAALVLVTLFFLKYEFMVVARQRIDLDKTGVSLLRTDNLSELSFLGKDKQLMREGQSFIYLSIPPKEKVGIALDFKKPIDLASGTIFLHLKRPDTPLRIEVTVRDNRFFSNSITPLLVEIDNKKGAEYINVPIDFKDANTQNANLTQVNQIKLHFFHKDQENINRTLIKNIILAKKEE